MRIEETIALVEIECVKAHYMRETESRDLITQFDSMANNVEFELQHHPEPKTKLEYEKFLADLMDRKAKYAALCSHLSPDVRDDLIRTYNQACDLIVHRVRQDLFASGLKDRV